MEFSKLNRIFFALKTTIATHKPIHMRTTIVVFFLIVETVLGCHSINTKNNGMALRDTTPSQIDVIDREEGRVLQIDGRTKDFVDTIQWNSRARYVAVMDIPTHFFVNPGTMLLCNIGSGSIARTYIQQQWTVEVAEPDSSMIEMAETKFRAGISDTALVYENGRNYLTTQSAPYDIILIDGIAPAHLPTEMLTKEFFTLVSSHIAKDGILGIAVESVGWNDAIVQSIGATLKEVFKDIIVLPIAEPPDKFGSIVILATNTNRNIVFDPNRNTSLDPEWRYGQEYQKTHAWDNHFTPDTHNGIILDDAFNRYDTMFTKLLDSSKTQPAEYIP